MVTPQSELECIPLSRSVWTAVYTEPGAERKAQAGLEDIGYGTFLPTYVKTIVHGRRMLTVERPLLQRYILLLMPAERMHSWSSINAVEGVARLLEVDGRPLQIPNHEVRDLMLGHAMGEWNRIIQEAKGRYSKRRRRPRLNKKARKMHSLLTKALALSRRG